MNQFTGKVVFITGAAQGMGLATAKEFASRGAAVVMTDVNTPKLDEAKTLIEDSGATVVSYTLDVTNKAQWQATVDNAHRKFGSIDILINNAAIFDTVPFEQTSEADWDRIMAVNTKGVLFGCQAVAGYMRQQKSGRIINMASQAGKTGGLIIGIPYSASKAAVICMTKTMAVALAGDNITVNAVAPGIIDTDFLQGVPGIDGFFGKIPLGNKPGKASDVAHAIAFLASDEASYITGEIMDVNGGLLMD